MVLRTLKQIFLKNSNDNTGESSSLLYCPHHMEMVNGKYTHVSIISYVNVVSAIITFSYQRLRGKTPEGLGKKMHKLIY